MESSSLPNGLDTASEDAGGSLAATDPITWIDTEYGLLSPEQRPHPAYKPLADDGIRLLKILPGDEGSNVCCYIEEFAIPTAPQYTALSYTWGSPYGVHEILINGSSSRVPKNLWRFLHQARSLGDDLSGWLWIDVLSINQCDVSERGHQVKLLSSTFARADRVVVWLGPAYQSSDVAMVALAKLDENGQKGECHAKLWRGNVGHAMLGICSRPYWRRLWVFQELRLAREVRLMCGEKTVEWHQISAVMDSADSGPKRLRHVDTVEVALRSPAVRMIRLKLQSVDTTLWSLVRLTSHLRCLDVRDKVYALLGVATGGCRGIEPDYSLPFPTLMNQLLREIFRLSPPSTLEEAAQRSEEVEDAMNVRRGTIFILQDQRGAHPPPCETDMRVCRLGPQVMSVSLWWTEFYGHESVQKLLLDSWQTEYFAIDKSFHGPLVDHTNTSVARELFHSCMVRRNMEVPAAFHELTTSEGRCNYAMTMNASRDFLAPRPPDVPSIKWLKGLGTRSCCHPRNRGSMILVLFSAGGYLACQENPLLMLMFQNAVELDDLDLLQELFKIQDLPDLNGTIANSSLYPKSADYWRDMPSFEYWRSAKYSDVLQPAHDVPLLCYAASRGATDCVRALTKLDHCDVNITDALGRTPIMHAAYAGYRDCVELLLGSGRCDINVCSQDGWTPLMYAADCTREDVLTPFMNTGKFDVNRLDLHHRTPILNLVYLGRDFAVQRFLRFDGCDVNLPDEQGWLPLTLAVHSAVVVEPRNAGSMLQFTCASIVRSLLRFPSCNVNARGRLGMSALHFAVAGGSIDLVKCLLERPECDVGLRSDDGETALSIATRDARTDIVHLLTTARSDILQKSRRRRAKKSRNKRARRAKLKKR